MFQSQIDLFGTPELAQHRPFLIMCKCTALIEEACPVQERAPILRVRMVIRIFGSRSGRDKNALANFPFVRPRN